MAQGFNTESDISAFVNTVFEDAMRVARDNNLMANLITGYGDRSGLAVRQSQTYGTATVNQVAETDDLVSQVFKPTSTATLTPVEFGAQFFVTDTRIETDIFQVRSEAALELGAAMGQSIEKNILGDFSSLTGGTIGGAGSVVAWGPIFAMEALLRGQNAPMPYVLVLHPYQWHVLAKAVSVAGGAQTNAPQFQDEVMRQWYVAHVANFDIYTSMNIGVSSSNATVAMFSRQSLALDMRRAPRIEPERDASRRGVELNLSAVYAHGAFPRPTFGVQATFDASTPVN